MPKCLELNKFNLGAATWNVVVKRDGKWDNDEPVGWFTGYPVPRKGDVIDFGALYGPCQWPLVVVDVIWHIRDEYAPEIEVRCQACRHSRRCPPSLRALARRMVNLLFRPAGGAEVRSKVS